MASTRLCNLRGSDAEPVASPAGPFITVFLSAGAFPLSRATHFSPRRRVFPQILCSQLLNNLEIPLDVSIMRRQPWWWRILINISGAFLEIPEGARGIPMDPVTLRRLPLEANRPPCWMWLKKLLVCFPLKLRRESNGIRSSERMKKFTSSARKNRRCLRNIELLMRCVFWPIFMLDSLTETNFYLKSYIYSWSKFIF